MSNSVFPALAGLGWSVIKTPQWNSRVQVAVGGNETRISFMSIPRWRWTLIHNFLRSTTQNGTAYVEFQTLAEFFNERQGKYDSFLYTDPTDSVIDDSSPATRQVFGTGNGSRTAFQLTRSLIIGTGVPEPIYNTNSTPKIYKNNVLQTVTTDYAINGSGLVTFTSAPAGGLVLTWSGSYYWRARFDTDAPDFENFSAGLWKQGGLSFLSILGS